MLNVRVFFVLYAASSKQDTYWIKKAKSGFVVQLFYGQDWEEAQALGLKSQPHLAMQNEKDKKRGSFSRLFRYSPPFPSL